MISYPKHPSLPLLLPWLVHILPPLFGLNVPYYEISRPLFTLHTLTHTCTCTLTHTHTLSLSHIHSFALNQQSQSLLSLCVCVSVHVHLYTFTLLLLLQSARQSSDKAGHNCMHYSRYQLMSTQPFRRISLFALIKRLNKFYYDWGYLVINGPINRCQLYSVCVSTKHGLNFRSSASSHSSQDYVYYYIRDTIRKISNKAQKSQMSRFSTQKLFFRCDQLFFLLPIKKLLTFEKNLENGQFFHNSILLQKTPG